MIEKIKLHTPPTRVELHNSDTRSTNEEKTYLDKYKRRMIKKYIHTHKETFRNGSISARDSKFPERNKSTAARQIRK